MWRACNAAASTNTSKREVAEVLSCRSAASWPSFFAPSATACTVCGRPPTMPNICCRVSTSLTGRPTCFAASAAMITCDQGDPLHPNAPPTNFVMTCTFSFGIANALAILLRTANTHCEES